MLSLLFLRKQKKHKDNTSFSNFEIYQQKINIIKLETIYLHNIIQRYRTLLCQLHKLI